jgi:glycosyltransferase involved in cell wall biosynthesis
MRRREARVLRRATRVVFTSPMTTQKMATLHPRHAAKFTTILNGFDDPPKEIPSSRTRDYLLLRHIGVVPKHRPPEELLEGLTLLRRDHPDIAARVRVEFVGSWDGDLPALVSRRGLCDLVAFVPPVSYDESRRLMAEADVLLLLPVTAESSEVIASILFDYLAAARPLLAISTAGSGDDWLLRSLGADRGTLARTPLHITESIVRFAHERQTRGRLPAPAWDVAQLKGRFHRRTLTHELATVFDSVLGSTSRWPRLRRSA